MIQPTNAQQLYPQPGGANAVSINIFNPQAYGNVPNNMQAPYQFQNSLYQMPQASAYAQPMMPQAYQQYMPMQAPVAPMMAAPAVVAPAPQVMPESVLTQQAQAQPQIQQEAQTVQPQTQAVEVQTPQTNVETINTDELIQGLKSTSDDVKSETINKIAALAQREPEVALQIVSEPIMTALTNVINEDTTKLAGPTPEQIKVVEKITKGEKLTPEEEALSEQLSPRDKANKNRIFSLFTLAMIQKLQRDELDQYIETQKANGQETIPPLKIQDLVGYNDVVNVIKNDARPEVKVAAIQALGYIANPEDKTVIQEVLAESLKSKDEAVKAAATEAMANFAA